MTNSRAAERRKMDRLVLFILTSLALGFHGASMFSTAIAGHDVLFSQMMTGAALVTIWFRLAA